MSGLLLFTKKGLVFSKSMSHRLLTVWVILGDVLRDQGELGQAKEYYEQALAIYQKRLGSRHVDVRNTFNSLSHLPRDRGELGQAKGSSEVETEYQSFFRDMDEDSIVIFSGNVVKEGIRWDLKQVAVQVIFPPGAVSEDRTLTLLRRNPRACCPPLLHHEAIVSDVIELSAMDSLEILHFNKAVTIVIPHCASSLKGYEVVVKTLINSETNDWADIVETEDLRIPDDIKEDLADSADVPDFLFPVAISKITQPSTFAVVCRLRSYRHTITSQESELVWPEFPLGRISFPQNVVRQDESFEVIVKVSGCGAGVFASERTCLLCDDMMDFMFGIHE
ncbi:uncharacterized protein [Montipora capricornis]|uniref:uncharacterized protein n=1 Tax=Montipora capricornis TaxID=246305 RepID=UPI0035F176D2